MIWLCRSDPINASMPYSQIAVMNLTLLPSTCWQSSNMLKVGRQKSRPILCQTTDFCPQYCRTSKISCCCVIWEYNLPRLSLG